jgi:hypothetical protein
MKPEKLDLLTELRKEEAPYYVVVDLVEKHNTKCDAFEAYGTDPFRRSAAYALLFGQGPPLTSALFWYIIMEGRDINSLTLFPRLRRELSVCRKFLAYCLDPLALIV